MPAPAVASPITVALVDDYDVVLIGLAHMFDHYRERVVVAEIDTNVPLVDAVDVALYRHVRPNRRRTTTRSGC